MTPADELRAAAAYIRQLTSAIDEKPHRWEAAHGRPENDPFGYEVMWYDDEGLVQEVLSNLDSVEARYFAAWQPSVALLVADWLEAEAEMISKGSSVVVDLGDSSWTPGHEIRTGINGAALALARALHPTTGDSE